MVCGDHFTLVLTSAGELYGWGSNRYAALAGATRSAQVATPTRIDVDGRRYVVLRVEMCCRKIVGMMLHANDSLKLPGTYWLVPSSGVTLPVGNYTKFTKEWTVCPFDLLYSDCTELLNYEDDMNTSTVITYPHVNGHFLMSVCRLTSNPKCTGPMYDGPTPVLSL